MKIPKLKSKTTVWVVAGLIVVLLGYLYWLHSKRHPSTDNAYVGANIVQIAPQVTGPLLKLYVDNFDTVQKGDPLFEIDPATFQADLDHAISQLDVAKQNVEALKKEIAAAQAAVEQRQSEVKLALQTDARVQELVRRKQLAAADGDKSTRDVHVTGAALLEANNKLQQLIATLGDPGIGNAEVRSAEARLAQAKLNLGYTHVVAPSNGFIVNLTARVGSMVQSNVVLFSIVDSSQWWVDANYKETELERIRPGQAAEVVVDIYPDHIFKGYVDNISRGSGAAFSIFPAENATGNWVKVTQRFPVRVYIENPDPNFPLRIGASSTVTIDTVSPPRKGIQSNHGKPQANAR
jgi:membrane fusion protein (multidrug efflux system)